MQVLQTIWAWVKDNPEKLWGYGIVAALVIGIIGLSVDYYLGYVKYVRGESKEPPYWFASDNGRDGGGILFMFCMLIIAWPLTLVGFAGVWIFCETRLGKAIVKFIASLHPSTVMAKLAIRNNRIVVLSSPDEKIRKLIK